MCREATGDAVGRRPGAGRQGIEIPVVALSLHALGAGAGMFQA
jgi:hypothetical protein